MRTTIASQILPIGGVFAVAVAYKSSSESEARKRDRHQFDSRKLVS